MTLSDERYFDDQALLTLVDSDPKAHEGGPSELWAKLACGRKFHLDRQSPEDPLSAQCIKRNTGSITHKLLELYDNGLDLEAHVGRTAQHENLQKALDTAWRLAERYTAEFAPNFWGKLLASEVRPSGRPGRLDRVYDVDEAAIARIERRFPVHMNGPGVYVWDLKTSGQADNNLSLRYEWGPAATMYVGSAIQEWPNTRGMIFLNAVPYAESNKKSDWFAAAVYPVEALLSEKAQRRFRLMEYQAALNAQGIGGCNVVNCFEYNRPCRHRVSGACEGL